MFQFKIQTMIIKFLSLGLLFITLIFTAGCNQKNNENTKVGTLKVDKLDIKKVKDDIVDIIVSLPDSRETVNLINETGASFIGGLTIEGISTAELLTRAEKARSYGYVMFDMAYANTYNQTNSFSKLLDIHQKLTQELGFEELLKKQEVFQERYMANRNNRDSVDQVVSELLNETNSYIQEKGSASDIALVFAGVTAKSLYVMSSLTLFAANNEKLVTLLKNQKDKVEAAINVLNMVPDNSDVDKMALSLQPVKALYSSDVFDITSVEKIMESTRIIFE